MTKIGLVRKMVQVLGLNPKNLWVGYVLGFALILILLTISQITSSWSENSAERHAKLSSIASDQTKLSQRIFAQFANISDQNFDDSMSLIKPLMLQYSDNYRLIRVLNSEFSYADTLIKHQADWTSSDIKMQHELFVTYYLKRLLDVTQNSTQKALQTSDEFNPVNFREQELKLAGLHQANERKLDAAKVKRNELTSSINFFSYIAAMVLLILEAVFIFWPGHVITSRYYHRSMRQKDQMWQLMRNLSKRNEEILEAYDRIGHDALHDSLTGLANRRYLQEELGRRVELHRPRHEKIGVCHIDLDKFKRVNDGHGHKAGDFVLRFVAKTLNAQKGRGDFVARIGGDEFVVVSSPVKDMAEMSSRAFELSTKLQRKLLIEGRPCEISASIGVDVVDIENFGEEIDVSDFLIRADIALYKAKSAGGGYECFTEELMIAHLRSTVLLDEISQGLLNREFVPYYQLQYSASTHEIVSAEALVRWRHPERGVLPPSEFLQAACEAGLEQQIDEMMIKEALRDLNQWQLDKSCTISSVAVNLSAKTIGNPSFISMIKGLEIPPGRLSFEITETVDVNQHSHQIIENVEYLKKLGFEVEIDDFGTGHASILSLQYLKPKRLKIDREFIFPIVEHEDQRQLVKNIIELSKPFNVEVVAEGVESLEHARILNEMGCDILQGYAFCKPIPAVGVTAIMSRERFSSRRKNKLA
jgi:diguanylate cyclase (GGDEF)-like protein